MTQTRHPITDSQTTPTLPVRAIAYPAIERHGIIGDRRTAALVSADGTLDWLCLPDYDGDIVFGALLDWHRGGFWRIGPAAMIQGEQSYDGETTILQTKWTLNSGELILQDTMLWPEGRRAPEHEACRVIVRSLKCVHGRVGCDFDLRPGFNFDERAPISFEERDGRISMQVDSCALRLWCNYPLKQEAHGLRGEIELTEGEEIWAVLETGAAGQWKQPGTPWNRVAVIGLNG